MKLLVRPTSPTAHHFAATGSEAELLALVNQIILDDEELETCSVVAELAGLLPDDATLATVVNWVNRTSKKVVVLLEHN